MIREEDLQKAFISPLKIGIAAVLVLALVVAFWSCAEFLDAKHVMVVQYPDGGLRPATEPGIYPQWFGTVTKYERRAQYSFGIKGSANPPLKIRFNDGGHAEISGAVSWEMPTKPEQLIRLQKDFASQEAIDSQLVSKVLNNAIYFSGPLMSSTESSGERRAEMLQYVEDQAKNGIYKMVTRPEKQKDAITGLEKMVNVVEIVRDANGVPQRSAGSAIGDYGITLVQTTVEDIKYDSVVEGQIKQRQEAITQVQIALANAKKADQDKLTVEAQGAANAAKSKWEQEVVKAREITKAEQEKRVAELSAEKEREVAKLNKEAAEYTKAEQILLGQGEAERKKLVMSADGALEKKLEAYNKAIAELSSAIKEAKPGAWSPQVVMGGTGGANSGIALVDLLMAKTARDLGLDLGIGGKEATRR
jgi:RNase P/RNase MRP subunit POP5